MYVLVLQALESKLASCRNFVKDQPRTMKGVGLTTTSSSSDSSRYATTLKCFKMLQNVSFLDHKIACANCCVLNAF